ncbi:amidohydrolase family protein, partial [Candidatus Sumerlaeota bacterium]|nr:amidohydrolase family protein [Candidatus Sumerlaeota bacterium]
LMLDAVKNIHQLAEVPLADALRMASLTPAQSLGLSDTGELSKSKRGNLILFDADFTLRYVIYEGFIIYAR